MKYYEEYLEGKKKYAEENKKTIEKAKTDNIPQAILWQKTVSDHLEDDKAKCVTIDGNFYFTEKLVNRLMYYSYLRGRCDIEKKSYDRGFSDCLEKMREKIDEMM